MLPGVENLRIIRPLFNVEGWGGGGGEQEVKGGGKSCKARPFFFCLSGPISRLPVLEVPLSYSVEFYLVVMGNASSDWLVLPKTETCPLWC